MQIDLNCPFTTNDVVVLIGSKGDSCHRQLRVTKGGVAYISDTVGNEDISGLAFRLETWSAGNGHTGPQAAADGVFVARIEKALRKNWPVPSDTYIEDF